MRNTAKMYHDNVVAEIKAGKRVSPLTAIRAHCYDCQGYQVAEIKRCPLKYCPLWGYRMGKNTTGGGRGSVKSGRKFQVIAKDGEKV